LYSGQTTNFRTLGGGFAPVFVVPEQDGDFINEKNALLSDTFRG
jgi:hypothetical protein